MRRTQRLVVTFGLALALAPAALSAQGRGGGAWTTAGGDSQRTGAVRSDPRISTERAKELQLLWKRQLDPRTRNAPVGQPVLLPNIISYKGFKALAYVAGSNTIYSIDYDLNRMFWERSLGAAPARSTTGCVPTNAAVTRPTPLPQAPGGRGRGAAPAGGGGGGFGRGNNNVYAVSTAGMVHALNPQTGEDANPPAKLLASGAPVSGVVLINDTVYAAVPSTCGSVAAGVYAMDLAESANTVRSWDSKGAAIAGSVGPAFASDGTIYVATGSSSGDGQFANAVIALDPATLQPKHWFTAAAPFTSSPVVFTRGERVLVAASNRDGSLYVLDGEALGGADHRTPLVKSAPFLEPLDFIPGAITTWEDNGTRRFAAASSGKLPAAATFRQSNGAVSGGSIVAFSLTGEGNALALEGAWSSADLTAPGAPIVVNGIVFAVSAGTEVPNKRAARSTLYALDAATGKELWNSGTAIASFVPGVPPSAGDGQVYVVGADGTLYVFGIPLEH